MWAVWVYLSVSLLSLTVQTTSLIRIMHQPVAVRLAKNGLLRTAYCRVAASLIYVGLGISGLFNLPQTGIAAFIALVVIQVMWQVNGLLDGRLSQQLSTSRPRTPWYQHYEFCRRMW